MAPNRRQAIIWTNADPVHWCIYAALGWDALRLPLRDCGRCGLSISAIMAWCQCSTNTRVKPLTEPNITGLTKCPKEPKSGVFTQRNVLEFVVCDAAARLWLWQSVSMTQYSRAGLRYMRFFQRMISMLFVYNEMGSRDCDSLSIQYNAKVSKDFKSLLTVLICWCPESTNSVLQHSTSQAKPLHLRWGIMRVICDTLCLGIRFPEIQSHKITETERLSPWQPYRHWMHSPSDQQTTWRRCDCHSDILS